ncbi:MAG: hypothetical protein EA375_03415 [Acholeplasmataceae bacterium]|nr:MAG: hypothetical protein EA375_03415 [Acholeplasmataceae bacterium]
MQEWGIILNFILIGVLMFVAKLMKTKLPVLNKVVIPTALLAGVIGLFIILALPATFMDKDAFRGQMGNIVYHALAIGFIALALKREPGKIKKKIWSTGMLITSTYALQAVIGILVVFLFFSDRFIGSGMLVALGFGQGPGLAWSIGNTWNDFLEGFGGTIGIAYSFLGFVFGGTIGVTLINIVSRRRGQAKPKSYEEESVGKTMVEIDTVKEISILDGITMQAIIISLIYGLVYLILLGSNALLGDDGVGGTVFGLIKGFNFIIGILLALGYKRILLLFERKGKNVRFVTNNYVLSNIASTAFNVMIAGAVLAIEPGFIREYGLQLLITAILAGSITMLYLFHMTKRIYKQYQEEYFIGLFGMLTGVASTGLALLKGIDPNLESPVAEEMVLGSGTAITMALPLFAILFIPSLTVGGPNETMWNWISLLGIMMYVVVFALILFIRTRKPEIE